MVALNRYRWPLPADPSGPPMAYPEPIPGYPMPPTMAAPSAPAVFPQGFTPPMAEEVAGGNFPTQAQGAQAAPEVSPEDEEFEREMEEEQIKAEWTRMSDKETAVLKVEAAMQNARNAVAAAHKKATQQKDAPDVPLNKVFDKFIKGHAPMPTYEEYRAAVRRPAPTEVLGWTGRTGAPSGPGYRSYLEQGGTPEELEGITEENYRRALRENAPSPYIAPSGPSMTPEQNRELVGRMLSRRETTMAPIREKLASISEERKKRRREAKPPTAWDIMEHQKEVERIKAGPPTAAEPEAPRYARGHKIGTLDNEILEAFDERDALIEELEVASKTGWWKSKAEQERITKLENRLDAIQGKIEGLQKERRSAAGVEGDYDYEAARKAGVTPDETGHWDSQFKPDDSPERYIDGLDTKSADQKDVIATYTQMAKQELGSNVSPQKIAKRAKEMAKAKGWKVE